LAEVALEQKIPFYQDSTNLGDGPTRNFLRHRVFPLLKERFPRAVPALNDLAAAWRQMIPSVDPDPEWRLEARGGWIGAAVWDGWSGIVKQAQLLAVATKTQEGLKLSRRFLEALARPDRKSRGQGSGWTWTRSRAVVRWESVVQPASKEYFVLAEPGVVYDLGSYRMSWEKGSFEPRPADTLFLPGIDASRDLVWRSVVSGMTFSSVEDGNWGRAKKRKRLGSLAPDRCALVLQAGFLRAVVDPKAKSILWAETGEEKLNNTGIFVTLV
jgi:hypothetical protein